MFVAVVGIGIVGAAVIGGSRGSHGDHSNYQDHANYSDAEILMEIQKKKAQLRQCELKIRRLENFDYDELHENFTDFLSQYTNKDPELGEKIEEILAKCDKETLDPTEFAENFAQYLSDTLEEDERVLEHLDDLINKINNITLT